VPPASAAYFLKGPAPDYRALGEALNVKAILTGTSLRLANHLRITMLLINASDRTIMWADTLSRDLRTADDLFAVRDAIVTAIVEKLRIRLEPVAVARAKARPTESLDAATAYMQGRYLLAATRGPANMAKAMTFFQRAIALDSLYAAPYSGLADVYAVYGTGNMADYNPNEFLPLARQGAEQALSLDPSLAEAHVSLGWTRMLYDFDWSGAEAELTRGIQLDSANSIAYAHRASLYQMLGQFDRALIEGRMAARRNPVDMQSLLAEGRGYFVTKQYPQATIALQRAAELNATDYLIRIVLGQVFEQRKMFDSALFELRTAVSLNPRSSRAHALLVHALASAGDTATAIAELHLLEEKLKVSYVPALDFAIAYVGLGDLPQTFAWLNKACEDHSIRPYLMDPGFDSIRSDPRYGVLMKRLHLPA
jgi:tetratricopeptide (TPR) repeat protein